MTPRIGVLGLGRMGGPIARRLGDRFAVAGYDPDPARAGSTSDPRQLAASSDVLVTVLPGPREVREALLDGGVLGALDQGTLWLDLSSNDPRVADELAAVAASRGVASAAAPIGGGPAEAEAGRLRFFVGASRADEPLVREVLAPLGSPFEPFAGTTPGAAHLAKLLANGLWFGQAVAAAEAFAVARAYGVDLEAFRGILAQSAGGSAFLDRHAAELLAGGTMPDFGIDRVVEELDTLEALAGEAGARHAVLAEVARVHREALEAAGPVLGELLGARLVLDAPRDGV